MSERKRPLRASAPARPSTPPRPGGAPPASDAAPRASGTAPPASTSAPAASAAASTRPARRPACVDVPALPLQLLLRRRPEWAGEPVAVVAKDEPQGLVLQVNEEARRHGVLPGQRYAAALALASELRAGVVPEDEVRRGIDETADRLRRFTPEVEPSREEPGVFWLGASGLALLHPDLRAWAEAIRGDLAAAGLAACVAVGFTRFGAYAVARALASRLLPADQRRAAPPQDPAGDVPEPPHRHDACRTGAAGCARNAPAADDRATPGSHGRAPPGRAGAQRAAPPHPVPSPSVGRDAARAGPRGPCGPAAGTRTPPRPPPPRVLAVFDDEDAERRALRRVPLDRLGIEPAVRDLLAKLGVRTVEAFLALPATGLSDRFGDEIARLHRLAGGDVRDPLAPEPPREPVRASVALEHPEADGTRLLFLLKRLLDPLLLRSAERREAVAGIEMRLRLDGADERVDVLRPAAPTLDAAQILDLLRLRLESARLARGATDVTLTAEGVPATPAQLELFAEKPRRDLAAADRALARLRAEFGDDAVVRARLRDAHLPEASFTWEPLERTQVPRSRVAAQAPPQAPSRPVLVRRLLARPVPLPPRPRHEPDGWMLRGFEHGNVIRIEGPFVVSGGWWAGDEVRREYHFAETSRGRLFWVFYDVRRRRWFLQGEVS